MAPLPEPVIIPCADGYRLHGTLFAPAAELDRHTTMLVSSALLVRSRFYARFAAAMASRGFRVITADNRGVGASLAAEPSPVTTSLRHWGERDLPAIVAWARASRPDDRLVLVGHSMGGQVVSLSDAMHELDAIVTVAATAAWWGHWPRRVGLGILAAYLALPMAGRVLRTLPADRVGFGPDVRFSVVREWARWGRDRAYMYGPFGITPQMHRYRGPVLVYSFSDDRLGSRRAVEVLHSNFTQADLTWAHLAPGDMGLREIGHFGYFRRGIGEPLWDHTVAWLDEALAGPTQR